EVCYLTLDFSGLDSIVWVDNITLFPVTGIYNEPKKKSRLFLNPTGSDLTYNLADTIFFNLDQLPVSGSLTLAPYTSVILIFDSSMILSAHNEILSRSPKIFPNPVSAGDMITLNLPFQYDQYEISIYDFAGRELF